MCGSYLVVLVLPCVYSVQSAMSHGVNNSSIATGILGMKAVLTSDLLPLLNGHFKINLCMCRLLLNLTQYVLTIKIIIFLFVLRLVVGW